MALEIVLSSSSRGVVQQWDTKAEQWVVPRRLVIASLPREKRPWPSMYQSTDGQCSPIRGGASASALSDAEKRQEGESKASMLEPLFESSSQ